jgi:hypothetical protein
VSERECPSRPPGASTALSIFFRKKSKIGQKTVTKQLRKGTESVMPKPREQEQNQLFLFPNRIHSSPVGRYFRCLASYHQIAQCRDPLEVHTIRINLLQPSPTAELGLDPMPGSGRLAFQGWWAPIALRNIKRRWGLGHELRGSRLPPHPTV